MALYLHSCRAVNIVGPSPTKFYLREKAHVSRNYLVLLNSFFCQSKFVARQRQFFRRFLTSAQMVFTPIIMIQKHNMSMNYNELENHKVLDLAGLSLGKHFVLFEDVSWSWVPTYLMADCTNFEKYLTHRFWCMAHSHTWFFFGIGFYESLLISVSDNSWSWQVVQSFYIVE